MITLEPPHLQQQRRRAIGAATLLVLAALVVAAQWWGGAKVRDRSLNSAWQTLAALDHAAPEERRELMVKAQDRFSRSAAVMSLEPLALIGAAVTERMTERWGQPVPLPPVASQCDEAEAAAWLRGALERGKPQEALRWAADPAIRRRGELAPLLRFAEGWQRAIDGQKTPTRP